jgi:ribonucleoside-diphosphate reductase alpha chain
MELSELAEQVAKERYYAKGEDYHGMCVRVSTSISKAETGQEAQDFWQAAYFNAIYNQCFMPAGRILRNAGFKRCLINCISLPIEDSIEAIADCIRNSLIVSASGGGIGIDFSTIRPAGAEIHGKGGHASGVISWMKIINISNAVIETGGARRGALLGMLSVEHPEIEAFLKAKFEVGELTNFNVSVGITNKFIEAVKADAPWQLHFLGRHYKEVSARKLWEDIVEAMIKYAEPGIINLDTVRDNHNAEYFAQFSSPNACSEQMLERFGVCVLGSVVLPRFYKHGRMQWKHLSEVIQLGVRFLDDTIDVTQYPIIQNKEAAEKSRKIGLGVIGLGDLLLKMGLRYGSEESTLFVEQLFKHIRDTAYLASVELAKERGFFPAFDSRYLQNNFVKSLPVRIRKEIEEHGIRNCCLVSGQPTGTTSLICGCSSGIEPIFSKAHWRDDRIGGKGMRPYIHPSIIEAEGSVPDHFVDAYDLTPEQHLLALATVQQFMDAAASKTINFPKGVDVKTVSKVLLKYVADLKGTTIYVDGTREGQVLTPMTDKEIKEQLEIAKAGQEAELDMKCKDGACDL